MSLVYKTTLIGSLTLHKFKSIELVLLTIAKDIYDEFPDNTWLWGIGQVFLNFGLIGFFKFGLAEAVTWQGQRGGGEDRTQVVHHVLTRWESCLPEP